MAANKGESFRLKLVKVTNKFGFTVKRVRAAEQTADGVNHAEKTKVMKVLDSGQISRRYEDINSYFDVNLDNQNNPDLKVLIYPAPHNVLTPDYIARPDIAEGDELYFNGYVHSVTRHDMLPIQDVNVYFTATCTRARPII